MARKDKKVKKTGANKPQKGGKQVDKNNQNFTPPKSISYLIDMGGVGGLFKIGLSLVAWIYLFLFQDRLDVLIWNTIILNAPCFIDIVEYKVPPNVQTPPFYKFRGWLIALFIIAFLFCLFLWGGSANAERLNFDNDIVKLTLKVSISLSIIGTGFSYIGKIYTENSRTKQAEDSK